MCENLFCIWSVYWIKDGKKIDIRENGGWFLEVIVDELLLNIKDVNFDDIGDY